MGYIMRIENLIKHWVLLFAALAVFMLLCQSCVTQSACAAKFPPVKSVADTVFVHDTIVKHDSVFVRQIIKDSVQSNPAVKDTGSLPCKENGSYRLKTANLEANINIKDGVAHWSIDLSATENRWISEINEKDRIINELRIDHKYATHNEVKVIVSVVEIIPWWAKLASWICVILLGWLAIRELLFKFTK